jgi:hypothetical protein
VVAGIRRDDPCALRRASPARSFSLPRDW